MQLFMTKPTAFSSCQSELVRLRFGLREALIKSASIISDLIFAIKSPSDEIKIASTPSWCVEFH